MKQSKQQKVQRQRRQLTKAQEIFAQELFKGASQRQAYYKAYPNSKSWAENSVDSNACALAKDAKVMQRLSELNSKAEKSTIYNAQQLREFWTNILLDGEAGIANRLKASELLGKSQGMFVEKRETSFSNKDDCIIKVVKSDD